MDYESVFQRLIAGNATKVARDAMNLADQVEDSLLGVEVAPDEYVEFFCKIFSSPTLVEKGRLEYFVNALYIEREKLSGEQFIRIVQCIPNAFEFCISEELACAICDFIVRTLPMSIGLGTMRELTQKSATVSAISGVFLGLDILRRQARSTQDVGLDEVEAVMAEAEEKYRSLQ